MKRILLSTIILFLSLTATAGFSISHVPQFSDSKTYLDKKHPTITVPSTGTATPSPSMEDFKIDCKPAEYALPLFSPSGNWMALRCIKDENPGLVVVNKDGVNLFLNYQDFYPPSEFKLDSFSYSGLSPVIWTRDEKYLYFSADISADGGGVCYYGSNRIGLYRVAVDTGKTSDVFRVPEKIHPMLVFEFSPDARYLAFMKFDTLEFPVILDMQTGNKKQVPVKAKGIGDLHWSPDGQTLAFAGCSIDPESKKEEIYRLFKYSIGNDETLQIYEVVHDWLYVEGFENNNRLIINLDYPYESGRVFIDMTTNKVVDDDSDK